MEGLRNLRIDLHQRRRAALMLGSILASGLSVPAMAQSLPPDAPPIRLPEDANGVDLASGNITTASQSISIGPVGQGGLIYSRELIGRYWYDQYDGILYFSGSQIIIELGNRRRSFSLSGGVYVSDQGDGATLASLGNGSYTYTAADGTVRNFGYANAGAWGTVVLSQISPGGHRLDFHYRTDEYCIEPFEPGEWVCYPTTRRQSVTSNQGYQVKMGYQADVVDPYDPATFVNLTSIKLINNATDYCNPSGDSCTGLTQAWPALTFSTTGYGGSRIDTVTDPVGSVTQYSYDTSERLAGIKRPGSSANDVTIGYDANSRVSSVAAPGHTTNYGWSLAGSTLTGVASDSVGTIRTTTANKDQGIVLTDKDGLNRQTSYTYDAYGRPTLVTYPEGEQVQYTYDSRGNVTQVTRVARPASGLANIVTSAGYDVTCSGPAKCNKPNWTKDELNNQTDYTYNTTTGQLLTVTAPAPTVGGTRPKVTYTYSSPYAWYKRTGSSIVQALTPVSKLATASTCLTGSSCAGNADEQKTMITYQVGSSGSASNLLVTSTNVKAGDNSVSATTSFAYDTVGNTVFVDGPNSGTGDTTAYRYDALRRPLGVIGPDPDGGSSLPNGASRLTYDTKGRVTTVEQGTTAGQTDTAWNNFTPAAKVVTTYDNADRKLAETLQNSSTAYAKSQYSYDARGRLDCSAVRMNPSVYGSLPSSACTLGTLGSFGKDRITKYTYNVGDDVTQVQTAYGTTAVASETFVYTSNRKVNWVVDANNNRTTYEYDGHDRPSKTRYPVATLGANSSSTTDYEQLTYDAASNVTNVRLRDGGTMTFTFDKLHRVITRTPPGEPVVNFGYNLLGMQTTIQRPSDGINIANAFDALGRLTSQTQPYGSASYQYDSAGNMTRLTWSDGHYVAYDRDNAYRVTKIRENGASSGIGVLATYAFDNLGRRSSVSYGNGTSRTYAWDPVNRLWGVQINLAGTTSDLIIGKVGSIGTNVAYNPASQIASLAKNNDAFAYTGRVNTSRTYTKNGLNQYTAAGGVSFGYDARGNLTSSGSNAYTYSKLNELKTGPGVTAMVYDGVGRLISYAAGTTTRFTYSGVNVIDERNTSGSILKRYVPGPGVDEPVVWYEGSGTTDRRFLQADERGSIIAVSDAAGNAIGVNRYDEFGIPQSTNIGRFQYTGQTWFPELGMYNFKARFYSATLGRFMQTDPIGYADGLNWYNYVGGDPVNATDPSGLWTVVAPVDMKLPDWEAQYSVNVVPDARLGGRESNDIVVVAPKPNPKPKPSPPVLPPLPQSGNDDIVVTARRPAVTSQFPNTIIFATYFDGQYIGDRRVLWKYRDHAAERVLAYLAGEHVENKILNQLTNQGAGTVAPGTLLRGFFNDDIVAWQWRAMVLPGGDISVGTVHLTWPTP